MDIHEVTVLKIMQDWMEQLEKPDKDIVSQAYEAGADRPSEPCPHPPESALSYW